MKNHGLKSAVSSRRVMILASSTESDSVDFAEVCNIK